MTNPTNPTEIAITTTISERGAQTQISLSHPALLTPMVFDAKHPGDLSPLQAANYYRGADATKCKLANDLIDALIRFLGVPEDNANNIVDCWDALAFPTFDCPFVPAPGGDLKINAHIQPIMIDQIRSGRDIPAISAKHVGACDPVAYADPDEFADFTFADIYPASVGGIAAFHA